MHETIRFENENGCSATIEIYGDADKVTVELLRGSHPVGKLVIHSVFDIHNIWDALLLQIKNVGHGNFKTDQEKFETTIQQAVDYFVPIATQYMDIDRIQVERLLESQRTEKEKNERITNFVKHIKIGVR